MVIQKIMSINCYYYLLTHWGRETHICVGKLTIIASDNGLSPERRQVIIWTNAGILLIGPLGTNVSEISIGIQTFSFKKMQLNMSSAKWRPFCLGLNVLKRARAPCWLCQLQCKKQSSVDQLCWPDRSSLMASAVLSVNYTAGWCFVMFFMIR